jgi:predicted transcriptional regulator
MQQGLFRASGMVTHHHLTVQTTLSSTLDYQAGGSLLVSTGGSLLESAEEKKKISKNKLAKLLKTSRTQVDRILDPKNDITLGSLQRAAAMVGRRVTIKLV